jgi:type II secretory ATPase GspE/PulE/Tfp pilus assembly ATPase PilB-like protein
MTAYKAVGCSRCENTGYSSRVAISEAIDINDDLKEMIDKGNNDLKIEDIQRNQPFYTMKQDGVIKVLQGVTTMEEILRIIES